MNTLQLATSLLRPSAKPQRKHKSGIKQMINSTSPSGFNQKLPLTIKKEEHIYRDNSVF